MYVCLPTFCIVWCSLLYNLLPFTIYTFNSHKNPPGLLFCAHLQIAQIAVMHEAHRKQSFWGRNIHLCLCICASYIVCACECEKRCMPFFICTHPKNGHVNYTCTWWFEILHFTTDSIEFVFENMKMNAQCQLQRDRVG